MTTGLNWWVCHRNSKKFKQLYGQYTFFEAKRVPISRLPSNSAPADFYSHTQMPIPQHLTDEEQQLCRKAFSQFDKDGVCASFWQSPAARNAPVCRWYIEDREHMCSCNRAGSGTIDVKELKAALESMGQHPSDEELFAIIHDVRLVSTASYKDSHMCWAPFVALFVKSLSARVHDY